MPVIRTYRCPDCDGIWDHVHSTSDEPYPDCPQCAIVPVWQPGGFTITGAKSQAVDLAQRVAEKQFGLTDMQDNLREGDVAVKLSPQQSKMAEGFWAPGSQSAALLASAKAGPAGPDPIAMLHQSKMPMPFKTVDWK